MKIAFISSMASVPWGGSEELWYKTAKLARVQGIDVSFSVYDWGKQYKKVLELVDLGCEVTTRHRIYFGTSFSERVRGKLNEKIWSLYDLRKILKRRPDVILFNQGIVYEVLTPSFIKFIKELRIPYFILTQGNPEFGKLPVTNLDDAQFVFKNATRVLFVSKRNAEVASRQFAMTHSNCEFVSNPPNLDTISIVPFPSRNRLLRCAYVGRLDAVGKGLAVLFQILSSEKWRDRDIKVSLYGEGPDRTYLEKLVQYYQLTEKVIFAGSKSDIKKIWEENECLLLPTITEGTPLSLIEAMSCGRTAVATDVGGIEELLVDNENGFLSLAPTVKLFDEAMERMWQKRQDLEELGKNAFKYITNRIDLNPEMRLLRLLINCVNFRNED